MTFTNAIPCLSSPITRPETLPAGTPGAALCCGRASEAHIRVAQITHVAPLKLLRSVLLLIDLVPKPGEGHKCRTSRYDANAVDYCQGITRDNSFRKFDLSPKEVEQTNTG